MPAYCLRAPVIVPSSGMVKNWISYLDEYTGTLLVFIFLVWYFSDVKDAI